jgi:hypothetical protein
MTAGAYSSASLVSLVMPTGKVPAKEVSLTILITYRSECMCKLTSTERTMCTGAHCLSSRTCTQARKSGWVQKQSKAPQTLLTPRTDTTQL